MDMQTDASTGYVELQSLSAALIVTDAMLKAAHVEMRVMHKPGGGLVCVHVFGDLASCQAAVAAGAALASISGALVQSAIIGRPSGDVVRLWEEEIPAMKRRKREREARKTADKNRSALPGSLPPRGQTKDEHDAGLDKGAPATAPGKSVKKNARLKVRKA